MEIIKGQTINELNEGDVELHNCNVDVLCGNVLATLVGCKVGRIGGSAFVKLDNCTIEIISDEATIMDAVDCNIGTIDQCVTVHTLRSSNVHNIKGHASVTEIKSRSSISNILDRCSIERICNTTISHISDNVSIDTLRDLTIDLLDGNAIVAACHNVEIKRIKEFAYLGSLSGSSVDTISGDSRLDELNNVKIKNIKDNTLISEMRDCIVDYVESSVVICKNHSCIFPDKDTVCAKHTDEYTLTQDTTPTLWKQVNNIKDDLEENHMKTLTVLLADFYTESHNNTIVKTLELLNGVDITRRNNNKVEIVCSDEAFEVISAMYLYDYMMVEELLE